jgi:hypothetical protein
MEKNWYVPKQPANCNFIIQQFKLYSNDGAAHNNLMIGEAVDWDVPSDNVTDNIGGVDASRKIVYQNGWETDGFGCQSNGNRYAGLALLGRYRNDPCALDMTSPPDNAYTESNITFIYDQGSFLPGQLYEKMKNTSGFQSYPFSEDIHSVMTYYKSTNLGPTDTLVIYSTLCTVRDGSLTTLRTSFDNARSWFLGYLNPCTGGCPDGDANTDGSINVADVVYIINYVFRGGSAPNPLPCGDANCDGNVNVADAVYIINFIFKGGPMPNCP